MNTIYKFLKSQSKFLGSFVLVLLCSFVLVFPANARDNVTDWYIKDFQSEIVVNKDSSLDITEKITADCGQCVDKHGIFRVLPTQAFASTNNPIKTPIKLTSITDFNDKPLKYSTITSYNNNTLTWKIGDADVTVQGLNYYKIKYHVQNAIRFSNSSFDEFYWNLNGNFWDIKTDNFQAKIILPSDIDVSKSEINLYSGSTGQKDVGLGSFKQLDNQTLEVDSIRTLKTNEGITISVTVPKGIFTPYVSTFWEKYGENLSYLIPIFVLIFCYLFWSKYGHDPKINPTIVPEFAVPDKMSPIQLGLVLSDGVLKNQYISAEIISLGVKSILKIEKIAKRGIFGIDDYKLRLLKNDDPSLTISEKKLKEKLFGSGKEILLSSLKNKFYEDIPDIKATAINDLLTKKLLVTRSRTMQLVFIILAGIIFFTSFSMFAFSILLGGNLILSAIILFVFSFLMKQRTLEGAQMVQKIKGFELYMKTAEKYRQKFNEKENIFERFLPYAIMFGITSLWIEKMKQIYGEKYFAHYYPVWFYGAGFQNFDARAFETTLNSMTSNMATTLASNPSNSGSGGGGFSGGGGGGGGGGGW